MKAIVYTEYGGPEVLTLANVAKPVPKENEVCIRVRAVSVNYGDISAFMRKCMRLNLSLNRYRLLITGLMNPSQAFF